MYSASQKIIHCLLCFLVFQDCERGQENSEIQREESKSGLSVPVFNGTLEYYGLYCLKHICRIITCFAISVSSLMNGKSVFWAQRENQSLHLNTNKWWNEGYVFLLLLWKLKVWGRGKREFVCKGFQTQQDKLVSGTAMGFLVWTIWSFLWLHVLHNIYFLWNCAHVFSSIHTCFVYLSNWPLQNNIGSVPVISSLNHNPFVVLSPDLSFFANWFRIKFILFSFTYDCLHVKNYHKEVTDSTKSVERRLLGLSFIKTSLYKGDQFYPRYILLNHSCLQSWM